MKIIFANHQSNLAIYAQRTLLEICAQPDLDMPLFQQWKGFIRDNRVGKSLTSYQLPEFAPVSQWVPGSANLWWEHRQTRYFLSQDLLSILWATSHNSAGHFFFLFLSEPMQLLIVKYTLSHQRNEKYLFLCKCGHISGNFWFQPNGPGFENNFHNVLKNVFYVFMALLSLLV